ncbi:hypothetical protein NQ176_g3896 [Zarea fungicola]|uniref:Uncharacterized protein n=1 Tax=Zarea fungicola TaxID=93591 RepID=A0ACC1NG29_9HYPO|nr:hypothetical protein NQ176_g3896 [Lecanicillium fungicola]
MISITNYIMNPSFLLVLARLAIGSPQSGSGAGADHPSIPSNPDELVSFTQGENTTILHADVIHENILLAMDDEHILHSNNLHDYFVNNDGANHTVYVNDTRVFIDMNSVKLVTDKKRQYSQ